MNLALKDEEVVTMIVVAIAVAALLVFGYMLLRSKSEYDRIMRHIRDVMNDQDVKF